MIVNNWKLYKQDTGAALTLPLLKATGEVLIHSSFAYSSREKVNRQGPKE
jgi:hypothetical protein